MNDALCTRRRLSIPLLVLCILVLFLAFHNLAGYPAFTALDEGIRLYFIRNVVQHGRWAILTQEGFQAYWRDSTGPVVLLPIMALFQVFGPSLLLARSLMAALLILSAGAAYLYTTYWYGHRVALLATLLFLIGGPEWLNSVTMGRWVYGEVPALGLFLLGCWQWSQALAGRREALALASGAFALAVLAKDLIAPMIIIALLVLYGASVVRAVDRLSFRDVLWPSLACLMAFIAWSLFQAYASSVHAAISGQQSDLAQLSLSRIVVLSLHNCVQNIKFLRDNDVLLLLPVVVYVAFLRQQSDKPGRLIVPVFVLVWSFWYVFFSIGWPRYAYPIWALSSMLLAVALADLWKWIQRWMATQHFVHQAASIMFIALLFGFMIMWPFQNTIRRLFEPADDTARIMALYIDTYIPPNDRIVSGQWEVHFYGKHLFVPIPDEYYNAKIAAQTRRSFQVSNFRTMHDLNAMYILDGSENRVTEMVSPAELMRDYDIVFATGEYCLYRVRSQRGP
ncbi:ArnT family glycosyltransferase [Chloroflexus islandicus]|uniref:ArnT family glycosyltransferase n=1 Tax=Chloroflexus islandicus TaxID=1707952 RepID=UPI0008348AE3|nr:hypothetical protein [Chloroflexus islandicus]